MSFWARSRTFLKDAFGRRRVEREMDAELRHHLASFIDDLIRRGIPRGQAERQAKIEFGNFEPLKEECRQARGLRLLDETRQDLRYAFRLLRQSPGFTVIAVLTLALGIGANTSIFSIVNDWVLKPLPYPDPDHLVGISELDTRQKAWGEVASADLYDWRQDRSVFSAICGYWTPLFTLLYENQPEQIAGARVNAEFFQLLGVRLQKGRDFTPQDDAPGAAPVAILTHDLWQSRFNSDPSLIGKMIPLDGQQIPVIGILPPRFHLPLLGNAEIFVPLALTTAQRIDRRTRYLDVIARVQPGVSVSRASGFLNTIARRLETAYPATNAHRGVRMQTLHDEIGQQVGNAQVVIVFSLVGCVLLIACGNVANLVVGRAVNRRKEMAVRLAIGAGRARLLRQLLIENLVLFLVAGATSVLFANWNVHWIAAIIPVKVRQYLPNAGAMGLDTNTLIYTFGIALLTGMIFGFAPAFRCWAVDVQDSLKDSTSRASISREGTHLKNTLIVCEIALALVVLVSAGLLAKGLVRMYATDPGIQPSGLSVAEVSLSSKRYSDPKRAEAFLADVLDQIQRMPGVKSAGACLLLPYSGNGNVTSYVIDGRPTPPPADLLRTRLDVVTPDYFRTMGIALLRGRGLSDQDRADSLPVAVINQAMARRDWPGGDPVGQRIHTGPNLGKALTIVGVVSDTRGQNMNDQIAPQAYIPHRQSPFRSMTIVMRTEAGAQDISSNLRRAVMAIDKDQAVARVQPMREIMDERHAPYIVVAQITVFFASLSLFLAALGIYGVMAYSVAARRREFGIRLALGAAGRDLAALIVRQGLLLALAGLTVGLAAALAVTRLLTSILYEVSPTDVSTFSAISLLLLVVALLACYVPAHRASTVDPNRALRYE